MPHSAASDLVLPCLPRPLYPNSQGKYSRPKYQQLELCDKQWLYTAPDKLITELKIKNTCNLSWDMQLHSSWTVRATNKSESWHIFRIHMLESAHLKTISEH